MGKTWVSSIQNRSDPLLSCPTQKLGGSVFLSLWHSQTQPAWLMVPIFWLFPKQLTKPSVGDSWLQRALGVVGVLRSCCHNRIG